MGFAFGKDLLFESFRDWDFAEFLALGILHKGLIMQPTTQIRVFFSQRQRIGKVRILRVGNTWPIEQQNFLGLLPIHEIPFLAERPEGFRQ